jgi:hypothetical protein
MNCPTAICTAANLSGTLARLGNGGLCAIEAANISTRHALARTPGDDGEPNVVEDDNDQSRYHTVAKYSTNIELGGSIAEVTILTILVARMIWASSLICSTPNSISGFSCSVRNATTATFLVVIRLARKLHVISVQDVVPGTLCNSRRWC